MIGSNCRLYVAVLSAGWILQVQLKKPYLIIYNRRFRLRVPPRPCFLL
jgi:hypothetical protein